MKRDAIFTWLRLGRLRALFGEATVQVENKMRYDEFMTFDNDHDIPDVATVKNLIDEGGGSVTKATQTITADENGMATLIDPPAFPIFTVYHEGGYTIPAQYDNLSRILSGLNPNEVHTIYMI